MKVSNLKNSFLKWIVGFLLIGSVTTNGFSQNVTLDISGKVVDRMDQPLQGCSVELEQWGLSIPSTGPQGNFTFTQDVPLSVNHNSPSTIPIHSVLKGNMLQINSQLENQLITVKVFEAGGGQTNNGISLTLRISFGETKINLNDEFNLSKSNSILFIQVKTGNQIKIHKYFKGLTSTKAVSSETLNTFSSKRAAPVLDTLTIKCNGLPDKRIFIENTSLTLGNIRVMKPNIVIMLADDLTREDIGVYGSANAKTPNIDLLASQGLKFNRAFTSTAMCAVTRQQMYTGLYPVRSGAWPNHSRVYDGTKSVAHYMADLGYRVGLNGKKHYKPAASYPFDEIGGNNINLTAIDEYIKRDNSEPYVLFVCSRSPHSPWNVGDATAHPPNNLVLPPYIADTPETRTARSKYHAEVTDLDRELGAVMQSVKEGGLEDNTLFIFTSEQGSAYPWAKWTTYDKGLNVGFIARWPAEFKSGIESEAMINYIDVVPTIIEAAGGVSIDSLDGTSFFDVLKGTEDEHNHVAFGIHTQLGALGSPDSGYPIRSIRTETHKYIRNLRPHETYGNNVTEGNEGGFWNSWVAAGQTDTHIDSMVNHFLTRPAEELYNLIDDPLELNNLSGDGQYRSLMDSLNIRLQAWMDNQGDKGIETEMLAPTRK